MTGWRDRTLFVDRSLGDRVGRLLRSAGLRVELHDDHFAQDEADEVWITTVAPTWIVLTKDQGIAKREIEIAAFSRARAETFVFMSGNLKAEDTADALCKAERRMLSHARDHPAPFIAKVYKDGRVRKWRTKRVLSQYL